MAHLVLKSEPLRMPWWRALVRDVPERLAASVYLRRDGVLLLLLETGPLTVVPGTLRGGLRDVLESAAVCFATGEPMMGRPLPLEELEQAMVDVDQKHPIHPVFLALALNAGGGVA